MSEETKGIDYSEMQCAYQNDDGTVTMLGMVKDQPNPAQWTLAAPVVHRAAEPLPANRMELK